MLLLFSAAITLTKAQSRPETRDEIIKEWAFLGESKTQLDVSYRVIKCSGTGEVHLQIFNESPKDQVAKFDIEIYNTDGTKFTKEVTFSVDRAAIVQPTCGETNLNDLKISLPANYNLQELKVKIIFK